MNDTLSQRLLNMAGKARTSGDLQSEMDLTAAAAAVDVLCETGADEETAANTHFFVALKDPVVPEDAVEGCECEHCLPQSFSNMRMILCATCGNKRCPHATHHKNACTGSNDPGQPGSAWEHVKKVTL